MLERGEGKMRFVQALAHLLTLLGLASCGGKLSDRSDGGAHSGFDGAKVEEAGKPVSGDGSGIDHPSDAQVLDALPACMPLQAGAACLPCTDGWSCPFAVQPQCPTGIEIGAACIAGSVCFTCAGAGIGMGIAWLCMRIRDNFGWSMLGSNSCSE